MHTSTIPAAVSLSDLAALVTATLGPIPPDDTDLYRAELDALLDRLEPPVAGRAKAKMAPTPGTTPPIAYGAYRFDVVEAMHDRRTVVVGMRPRVLRGILERLSFHRDRVTGRPLPYTDVRTWWCLINIRLNELGRDAPGFRPNRRVVRALGGYGGEDTLLTNDRQVIDLHWLWESGAPVHPKPKHRALFNSVYPETEAAYFPWTLAERFVGCVGSIDRKLGDLKLNEEDQLGLMALCTDRAKKRRQDMMERSDLLEGVLLRRASRHGSRLDPQSIPEWVKDYIALRAADGSPRLAMDARIRLFGATGDARHLTNRKRDLNKLGYRVREGRPGTH